MKNTLAVAFFAVGLAGTNLAYSQSSYSNNRSDRYEYSPSSQRSGSDLERRLIDAYKMGYKDGKKDAKDNFEKNQRSAWNQRDNDYKSDNNGPGPRNNRNSEPRKPYKAFTGGFYVGANSTRFRGEDVDGSDLTGRLGYQVGVFARGGGRLYGQIGAEYFASSSNFFRPGDGQSLSDISERIDTKWVQIPAYIGVKLAQSKRGISGIRLAVGAEYANRLSSESNSVEVNETEIKSGTFLALGNLGFDIGPVFIDLVYHHGLNDAIKGFNNSQRRTVSANFGFKF